MRIPIPRRATAVVPRIATRCSSFATPKRQVVFSGIQPTGVPHLGNYLGAMNQWVKLQDEAPSDTKLFFSIVDLHAITVPQSPEDLARNKKELLAALLAIGLDPSRSTIFYQSDVSEHSELMWILSCNASMGKLSRMTQWKSKLDIDKKSSLEDATQKANLQLGLFSYPVLQAADVLLYKATHVPVGDDQAQHLEFARDCAGSFNALYGPVFVEPETIISPAKRVMSLLNPRDKMSKSAANPKSRILLNDSRDVIFEKVKGALTDSLSGLEHLPAARPGVANLLEIMHHVEQARDIPQILEELRGVSMKEFKAKVSESIETRVAPVRSEWERLMSEEKSQYLQDVVRAGAEQASAVARETMREVKDAIGLSASRS